jgi:hypothetical protein
MIAADSGVLLVLPNYPFTGYEFVACIAEESLAAFATELKYFAAFGAERIHIKFVVEGKTVAGFAEKADAVQGKLFYHLRTAFTA